MGPRFSPRYRPAGPAYLPHPTAASHRRRLTLPAGRGDGLARERSDQTVTEAAEEWIATRPEKRKKDDRPRLDHHILPLLRELRLSEVGANIEKFVRQLEVRRTARKGDKNKKGRMLKPNSIKNILITLRKMMNDLGYPLKVK